MKETLQQFASNDFPTALDQFFNVLDIPTHPGIPQPGLFSDFLNPEKVTLNDDLRAKVGDVHLYGMVDEKAFQNKERETNPEDLKESGEIDYDGILLFGIELIGENPTRTTMADITRLLNRSYNYTPVVVIFKYKEHLAFANCERIKYKQAWREGEKAGKVSLLRDVHYIDPHSAHLRILHTLTIEGIRENDRRNKVESYDDLYRAWMRVFNTDILNEQFYRDYQQLSVKLIRKIHPDQIENKVDAHQGALNLLNRMMFVYFVQEKGWMMGDQNFLYHFWQDYQEHAAEEDTFHEYWLNKLFFSAFNGKAYKDPDLFKHLPEKYHSAILDFPYLNGGLFTRHSDYDSFLLPDQLFEDIFEYLESYIFTISEDTAEDINLEINPELLGKMYEGMINATDLDDVEAENGIVYTERPEINFMTRRSFVEVLDEKLEDAVTREFLYHFIFDKPNAKQELLDKYSPNIDLLKEAVISVRACDPACGSGSMLLGVIQLQMELLRALDQWQGQPHTPRDDFELKKQLISESIYGVDIKEWAVRIAELRFWLYMIAEAEFTTEELTENPLLPNLDFKIRCGNSLLPKLGNLDFDIKELLKGRDKRSGATKKLHEFIKRKKQFIRNDLPDETYDSLKDQEIRAVTSFVQELIIEKSSELRTIKSRKQQDMFGDGEDNDVFKERRAELEEEIEALEETQQKIKETGRLPFSYDIDFMEIFLTQDDPGFDLVIGNPPYVRQEDILPPEDPELLEELLKDENKSKKRKISKAYKKELSDKVFDTYPFLGTTIRTEFNGRRQTIPIYGKKVPGRSDLYVYFQLLCPQYLNSKGTFCFIISNSWMDVDYGSFVQQFLLKHTRLHSIYDSNVRSFSAKVNTVIYLHSALQNTELPERDIKTLNPPDKDARFVMNKTNYTDAAYAPVLIEQDHCKENTFRKFYRVIVESQIELFESGYNEESAKYEGEKWNGKYLRAPEIYFKLKNKGRNKFVELGKIAKVSRGFTSGANDFFYLSEKDKGKHEIENKYLKPLLKGPKDVKKVILDKESFKYDVFLCTKNKNELTGQNALRYIQKAEKEGINERVSFNGKSHWWKLSEEETNQLFTSKGPWERHFFAYSPDPIFADQQIYRIFLKRNINDLLICGLLNSTMTALFLEIIGRSNFGEGILWLATYEIAELPVLFHLEDDKKRKIINKITEIGKRNIEGIFDELGFDKEKSIRSQQPEPKPDRKALDDIIFDELGLTHVERNEVYWSVAELVKQRLDKAASR